MKKLTIIGGGSVRAPFFANSLAKRAHTLHISTLCLYDIDSEKLRVIGSIAKHAVAKIAPDLQVILETDLTKAITGTDYFVTTIRVGGDHSRVVDEQIAIKNGVLGQETTGAGGFFMAAGPSLFWRTIVAGSKNWHRMRGSSISPTPLD